MLQCVWARDRHVNHKLNMMCDPLLLTIHQRIQRQIRLEESFASGGWYQTTE